MGLKKRADYLFGRVCLDCGESNPLLLDFHHWNPAVKTKAVSALISGGYSERRINEEVARCVCVCVSCHRLFHSQERERRKDELVEY